MARPWPTCNLPTIGMLFSAWQAMTQALQRLQVVEIDGHAPLLGVIELGWCKAWAVASAVPRRPRFLHELLVAAIMLEGRLAHESAAFDREMFLRGGEGISAGDFFHRHFLDPFFIREDEMRIGASAEQIAVEAGFFADRAGVFAAVA